MDPLKIFAMIYTGVIFSGIVLIIVLGSIFPYIIGTILFLGLFLVGVCVFLWCTYDMVYVKLKLYKEYKNLERNESDE